MAKLTFYPLGNADSCLIEFTDERLMLVDYFQRNPSGKDDKRADLSGRLRAMLDEKEKDYFDVIVFTHRDSDHVNGAEDFFWLEHAEKYQGNDHIKMKEMWVPACYILEEGLVGSSRVIRQEARHRLKEGDGILVFSQPDALDDWLKNEGIDPKDRANLIKTAGSCEPGFTKENGQAEIFIHSPFKFQVDEQEIDQNSASLVLHITFFEGEHISRAWFGADTPNDVCKWIVYKTKEKKRFNRLIWDIFKLSHHCSYKALSEEKGKDKTEPIKNVKYLFDQGQSGCYLISSSDVVPAKNTKQPPHKQAAAYYKEVASDKTGEFLVTMETPTKEKPKEIVIEISKNGLTWKKITGVAVGAGAAMSRASARQGKAYGI